MKNIGSKFSKSPTCYRPSDHMSTVEDANAAKRGFASLWKRNRVAIANLFYFDYRL